MTDFTPAPESSAHRWKDDMLSLTLALVGGAALWSSLRAWDSLTVAGGGLIAPLVCVILVALTSSLVRVTGRGAWLSLPLAALVGLSVPLTVAGAGVLPTPSALSSLLSALRNDAAAVRDFTVPIPAEGGTLTVTITTAALVLALLVDSLLVRRGWASGVGFVLLVLHVVPSYFGIPVGWLDFALTAALFVVALALLQQRVESPWRAPSPAVSPAAAPSSAAASSPKTRAFSGYHGAHVAAAGITAIALATVVTMALPLPERPWWQGGSSGGSGDDVTIANPLLDLRRDLTRGADIDLLTVRGSGPAPSYLRTAVLTEYDGEQWRTGDRRASESDRAGGALSLPPGLSDEVMVAEHEWTFSAANRFRSRWLPLPTQFSSVTAEGDWRTDTMARDFVAWDPELDTAGAEWAATELSPELSAELLNGASQAKPAGGPLWTEFPDSLPAIVPRLAREVTAEASTPFERATALQQWFRSEFDYSLETVETVGNDDLVAFLSPEGRVGYCEQFAASMALMARTLDIPARVAVGFLSPESRPNGTHVFSAHDLHAWPELYFEGAGWVRFEPTPGERADEIPEYTPERNEVEEASPSPSTAPSASPQNPTDTPSTPASPRPEPNDRPVADKESTNWRPILGATGGLVLLAGLLALPRLVRQRRRGNRLASHDPEDWWREVKDSARDLGVRVPSGLSPRQGADVLLSSRVTIAPGALSPWVQAVESARYAPAPLPAVPDSDALRELVIGMSAGLPRSERLRAACWPVSVFSG